MKKIFQNILKHPYLALALCLLISLPFLIYLPKIQTVDNVDYFTPKDDPDVIFYEKFKKIFGNDEFFIISFKQKNLFSTTYLSLIKELTENIENFPEVREVLSLSNVDDIRGDENAFYVKKFLDTIPSTKEKIEMLKQRALSNKMYVENLISKDGSTCAIIVFPKEEKHNKEFRKILFDRVFNLLDNYKRQYHVKFHVAGMSLTNLRLSQFMKKDMRIFIPISYIVILFTIYILFRNVTILLIVFLNVSLCLDTTLGLLPMLGYTLNNITSIIPPLIMSICIADSIHIMSQYLANYKEIGDINDAMYKTLLEEYKPCFLTSLTTFVGFLSLLWSELPPIKQFAVVACGGIVLGYFISFVFLPCLVVIFKLKITKTQQVPFASLIKTINKTVSNYSRYIITVSIILMALSCVLIKNINVETNLINFFKKNTQLRKSMDFIEKNLAGLETIQISLSSTKRDFFLYPENLHIMDKVCKTLSLNKEIDKVNSFVDFIKQMNKAFHNEDNHFYTIPKNKATVAQYLLLYDSDDINDYINEEYNHVRIVARTSIHGSRELKKLIDNINKQLKLIVPSSIDFRITGESKKVVDIVNYIVNGQIESIVTAFLVISIFMFLMLRSFSLGILSLIPNIFPLLFNFLIMVICSIPLNTATSLISAIAIGIVVDDTIHYLYQYKEERIIGRDINGAIETALIKKGPAMIITSIILTAGFGILCLSSFIPTIQFGVLTSIVMVSALFADLFLSPSLLKKVKI